MKKVLIKAYAQLNLGDDLFIKMLCERYENTNFYIFTTSEYENLKGIDSNNLKIMYNNSLLKRVLSNLGRKCGIPNILEDIFSKNIDAVVNIGGSIFIENKFSEEDFKIRERNLKNGKNYFVLGSNFGPYKDEEFKEKYYNFFEKCQDVCFRERYSYDIFKDLENVRFGKDIVFNLKGNSVEGDYVLFSIILPSKRDELIKFESEYFNRLKALVLEIVKNGRKIKFMSFCKGEGDEEAIEKLFNMIPNKYHKNISIYFYRGDLKEAIEIIANANSIVATRFHAMILGFVFKKTVFPVAYSKKMTNILDELEFKGNFVTLQNMRDLTYEKFIENTPLPLNVLARASQDGERHFIKLDEFLQ
ncbi:polysaccharide pyruvyl transferase family protein [uncultured Cetobacterium sp.]|uniref:polysaccharide pyruvyl transferase family protein n=1 Tax=uncultured Cetobacterium sp. TaxID=527638 RepID=UPI0026096157|nr:polysaccharide pyruvyl transferase family protein [uncultured Cetobacterium sp.]